MGCCASASAAARVGRSSIVRPVLPACQTHTQGRGGVEVVRLRAVCGEHDVRSLPRVPRGLSGPLLNTKNSMPQHAALPRSRQEVSTNHNNAPSGIPWRDNRRCKSNDAFGRATLLLAVRRDSPLFNPVDQVLHNNKIAVCTHLLEGEQPQSVLMQPTVFGGAVPTKAGAYAIAHISPCRRLALSPGGSLVGETDSVKLTTRRPVQHNTACYVMPTGSWWHYLRSKLINGAQRAHDIETCAVLRSLGADIAGPAYCHVYVTLGSSKCMALATRLETMGSAVHAVSAVSDNVWQQLVMSSFTAC